MTRPVEQRPQLPRTRGKKRKTLFQIVGPSGEVLAVGTSRKGAEAWLVGFGSGCRLEEVLP